MPTSVAPARVDAPTTLHMRLHLTRVPGLEAQTITSGSKTLTLWDIQRSAEFIYGVWGAAISVELHESGAIGRIERSIDRGWEFADPVLRDAAAAFAAAELARTRNGVARYLTALMLGEHEDELIPVSFFEANVAKRVTEIETHLPSVERIEIGSLVLDMLISLRGINMNVAARAIAMIERLSTLPSRVALTKARHAMEMRLLSDEEDLRRSKIATEIDREATTRLALKIKRAHMSEREELLVRTADLGVEHAEQLRTPLTPTRGEVWIEGPSES